MLEAKIHKEITEYEGKIFFGMTLKQLAAVVVCICIAVPLFFVLLNKGVSIETAGWISMGTILPIVAFAFLKIRGFSLIKFIKIYYRFYFKDRNLRCVNNIATDYIEGVKDNANRRVRNNRKVTRGIECQRFGYIAGSKSQLRKKRKELRKYFAVYKKKCIR